MKLPIYTIKGEKGSDEVELRDSVFGIEPNETVIYEDVRRYLANRRQGTAKTKERSEVRGGGRKAYRQKGTGMARRGSTRSPLLKGGGTVFGPRPRVHKVKMNKKLRRLARKSALSLKSSGKNITVVEDFKFDEIKTRQIADIMTAFEWTNMKVLILTSETDLTIYKSARNIPGVQVLEANNVTTYEILDAEVLLLQKSAIEVLRESVEPTEEAAA